MRWQIGLQSIHITGITTVHDTTWGQVKGTVSPDIAFYFRVYIFKTVLSVRQLTVFKFVYFVVL